MNNPKITVVTVCYNAAKTLEKTIQSVINQTYNNIEYIIIDGASTDGTLDIIKKYDGRISYWKSEPDKGIYDAMNKGIEAATGEWINFMNSGDAFTDENVIAKIFDRKEFDDCIGFIFGQTMTKKGLVKDVPFYLSKKKFKVIGICHQSTFVRTTLAKQYPFDLSFKIAADYKQLKTIYDADFIAERLPFEVSYYDLCGMSANNEHELVKEIAKICNIENTLPYYLRCIRVFVKSLLKKIFNLLSIRFI